MMRFSLGLTLSLGLAMLTLGCPSFSASGPFGGSATIGYDGGGGRHDRGPAEVARNRGGGPPPWAPAKGYRKKRRYHYYPEHEVYFNIRSSEYCWLDGGRWHFGVELPDSLRISIGGRGGYVSLELEGDRPDRYHSQVVSVHPKSKKNKGKRPKPAKAGKPGKKKNQGDQGEGGKGRGRGRGRNR